MTQCRTHSASSSEVLNQRSCMSCFATLGWILNLNKQLRRRHTTAHGHSALTDCLPNCARGDVSGQQLFELPYTDHQVGFNGQSFTISTVEPSERHRSDRQYRFVVDWNSPVTKAHVINSRGEGRGKVHYQFNHRVEWERLTTNPGLSIV